MRFFLCLSRGSLMMLVVVTASACTKGKSSQTAQEPATATTAPASPAEPPAAAASASVDGDAGDPDEAAILAAATEYTRENAAEGMTFSIQPHAKEGDFALVIVMPEDDEYQDGATLLLKREGGNWRGLGMGTGMDCDYLLQEGAPEALCDKL